MVFRQIFILGAGAIGSVFGALLSENNNVLLIGNKMHIEKIREKGLEIVGDINRTFYIDVASRIEVVPHGSLIILTTKAYDSVNAVKPIKPLLREDSVILVLQNGLGNEEIVKEAVGNKIRIFRGITSMAAETLGYGKVKFWLGETIIENSPITRDIMKIFNESGLKTRLADDIKIEVWRKLVLNCVINPLTAILRVRNNEIYIDELKWVRRKVAEECIRVGEAEGIVFESDFIDEIDRKIMRYTNLSSMLQDIIKCKKTEIDFLNGKIIELGNLHGISTPVNKTLYHLIKFMEVGKCSSMK